MTETPQLAGPVVVTGALGNVGAAVVQALAARGVAVRAADIRPDALTARFGDGLDVARLDFGDAATFGPVLKDARSLFLIRPPAISRVGPTLNRFVDAAVEAGVEHVVFSSVAGAESDRIVPHHRVEKHLLASGLEWTILRPGFFSQNIGSAYRQDIVEDDKGDAEPVTDTVERLLGRPARTVREYVTDHAQTWSVSGSRSA